MKKRSSKTPGCVVCQKTPVQSRGLCATHHSRFHRQRSALAPELRDAFEEKLMQRGMLLPPKAPGRKVEKDEFRLVADELTVAETKTAFTESPARKRAKPKAARGKAASKKAASKKASPKKATRKKAKSTTAKAKKKATRKRKS